MSMHPLVFSTRSYAYLATALCRHTGFEPGLIESQDFPDGEHYHRIVSPVRGRQVILIGGTVDDAHTLELYDLACALVKQGGAQLTVIIPYYGYSTMERAVLNGEVVKAKTRARLLSSIPQASSGNRILLLDLHSEGIPHYFEGGVVTTHLYAKQVVMQAARDLGGADFVLACTDAGRAKWVESLANDLGVLPAFVFKKRLDGSTTQVKAVSAQVQGCTVIIYDDMIRTGGSLIQAAQAYRDAGAADIAAICTHTLMPGASLEKLQKSGLFRKIICTDSHPRALDLQSDFLEVRSVAGIFADFFTRNDTFRES